MIEHLDVGAGTSPHPDATKTMDARTDLDNIYYKGVDIQADRWPIENNSVERVTMMHVIEHLNPDNLEHVWKELSRILAPGGIANVHTPHIGTFAAGRNPNHRALGGFSLELGQYLAGERPKWGSPPDWSVDYWTLFESPVFVRPALRLQKRITSPRLAFEAARIPYSKMKLQIKIVEL
jgi:SAM-dependent methyltransferase